MLSEEDASLLKLYNGLRNAIVHKYDNINLDIVKEGLDRIGEVYEIIIKLIEAFEKIN